MKTQKLNLSLLILLFLLYPLHSQQDTTQKIITSETEVASQALKNIKSDSLDFSKAEAAQDDIGKPPSAVRASEKSFLDPLFTYAFVIGIGVALLILIFILLKEIFIDGRRIGDVAVRCLCFAVGLLIVIAIDILANISISDLVVRSYTKVNFSDFDSILGPIVISLLFSFIGILMARKLRSRVENDNIIQKRYFILVSTIILFYLVRVYVLAWEDNNEQAMIADLAFILGYSFIIINNNSIKIKEKISEAKMSLSSKNEITEKDLNF